MNSNEIISIIFNIYLQKNTQITWHDSTIGVPHIQSKWNSSWMEEYQKLTLWTLEESYLSNLYTKRKCVPALIILFINEKFWLCGGIFQE